MPPAAAQGRSCSPLSQSLTVREVMRDWYYWYREIPDLDPARYASPEAYLDAIRYQPFDRTFSYITTQAANEAYYGNSQFVGFGLSARLVEDELRVQAAFEGSPASEAGLGRGARVLSINGRSVEALVGANALDAAWGPATPGVEAAIVFETRNGERREATMVKRVVTIPTVPSSRVVELDGRRVGYFELRNFVEPSFDAVAAVVDEFARARVSEVIVDLRYNGGGLVDVAVDLASSLGGAAARGQVFAEMRHNDRRASEDETLRFRSDGPTLELSRVVVIATRASASASELLINGLKPWLPVTVVGDATYGKPVGQYGFTFCEKVLAPVAFSIVNARGEGEYFSGIPADCAAADDLAHDLGEAEEASLSEALHVARTGSCSAASSAARSRSLRAGDGALRLTGWRALVNAY